jgi:hypothetical protein
VSSVEQADQIGFAEPFRLAFTTAIEQGAVDQPGSLAGPVAAQPGRALSRIVVHQAFLSNSAPRSSSTCRIGRSVLIVAGQPGSEPLDRRLELEVHFDERPQLLADLLERHGLRAAPLDELLDPTIREVLPPDPTNVRGGAPGPAPDDQFSVRRKIRESEPLHLQLTMTPPDIAM